MAASASTLDYQTQARVPSAGTGRRRGRKQPLEPLFDGQHLTCPRCRTKRIILDYTVKPEMPAYQHETVPILICPCSWEFALRPTPYDLPRRMA